MPWKGYAVAWQFKVRLIDQLLHAHRAEDLRCYRQDVWLLSEDREHRLCRPAPDDSVYSYIFQLGF